MGFECMTASHPIILYNFTQFCRRSYTQGIINYISATSPTQTSHQSQDLTMHIHFLRAYTHMGASGTNTGYQKSLTFKNHVAKTRNLTSYLQNEVQCFNCNDTIPISIGIIIRLRCTGFVYIFSIFEHTGNSDMECISR